MLIRVDLPAPFSPMMPVIEPAGMLSDTPRLASTAPNALSIPRSSIARGAGPGDIADPGPSVRAGVGGQLVAPDDPAGDDLGLQAIDGRLQLRGDERAVVLVERTVDAALREPEHAQAGLPAAVHRGLEAVVRHQVHALDHRGQDGAGVDVVLVAVDADR